LILLSRYIDMLPCSLLTFRGMITVNGKSRQWEKELNFSEIYDFLGYTLKEPIVTVKVNGRLVPKEDRENYSIPDGAIIEITNILRGG